MKQSTFYLIPVDGRKSFYNKAVMIERENGEKLLKSYETIEYYPGGQFVRIWPGYSATTARHVNAFRAACGLPGMNKKEWDALKVEG